MLNLGDTLQYGRYRIGSHISQGGMGSVYEAWDNNLRNKVALKEALLTSRRVRHAFEREARLLSRLRHSALPIAIDYFEEGGKQYFVMDYIEGEDLAQQLKKQKSPFRLEQVLAWADDLLNALDYLHKQTPPLIHRDIKPANLKLTDSGKIILLDFGLAKGGLTEESDNTIVHGHTPRYAPPEQMARQSTDPRSDLYALGATFYHLLTNAPPPDAVKRIAMGGSDSLLPVNQLNPQVPKAVAEVLTKAMTLEPNQRFASAAEMRAAFAQSTSTAPTVVSPPPPYQVPLPRWNWPLVLALITAIAIGGIAFSGILEDALPEPNVAISSVLSVIPFILGGVAAFALLAVTFMLVRSGLGTLKAKIDESGKKIGQREESRSGNQQSSQTPIDNNPYQTRQLSPETLMAQEQPKKRIFRVKDGLQDIEHIIEPLIDHHLRQIEAKFSMRGATRLFLTGFGSFGGTSLVRATTAKLLEGVKNNQGEQVFVLRFDTSRRLHSGEYQLFVNENLVGTLKEPVDQDVLLAKINHALSQAAKSDNPQASNTLVQVDFFAGMTMLFAQDVAATQAITDLVCQVLKLLESEHDDNAMHRALNNLLATSSSSQLRQVVLIIDHLEREEAMQQLMNCPLCHEFSYPGLSLVVVAGHQAFMRWGEGLREQIREQRRLEYYYIRRLWLEDFDVRKMLNHFMHFDVSALNEQEQQRFDKLLAHLTYKARGSVARVSLELRKGPYLSKEGDTMAIHLDAIYKHGRESIEHNVRVQLLLEQNWNKILGHGMVSSHVEMADQARVGVYYVIEWIRRHPIFKIEKLVAAVRTKKIAISNHDSIFEEVLIHLLIVLEKESYLQYQPQTERYHLTWQKKKSQFSFMWMRTRSKEIRQQVVQALQEERRGKAEALISCPVGTTSATSGRAEALTTSGSKLRIALLGDGREGAQQVVSLATQIAFEVIEAAHCLVMTDRGGIERVVREKLEPYWSLYAEDFPSKGERPYEIVPQVSNLKEEAKRLLEKCNVIILVQEDERTDSAFVTLVKMMAEGEGVPIIEPFADLDPAESFFVPDVACRALESAQKACSVA